MESQVYLLSKQMKNYCTLQNGAFIAEEAKNQNTTSAFHVLTDINTKKWSIEKPTKAFCVIELRALKQRPEYFNTISFYSHDAQLKNVSIIKVYYRAQQEWNLLGKFRLQLHSGWQSFKLRNYRQEQIQSLGLYLEDNFGGSCVELTQVALGCAQEHKQDQLTRIFAKLREENQLLKKTVQEYRNGWSQFQQMKKQIANLQKQHQELSQRILESQQGSLVCQHPLESVVIQAEDNASNLSSQQLYHLDMSFSDLQVEQKQARQQFELL